MNVQPFERRLYPLPSRLFVALFFRFQWVVVDQSELRHFLIRSCCVDRFSILMTVYQSERLRYGYRDSLIQW